MAEACAARLLNTVPVSSMMQQIEWYKSSVMASDCERFFSNLHQDIVSHNQCMWVTRAETNSKEPRPVLIHLTY